MTEPARDTVLDHLVASLRERAAPLDGQAPPDAVLWTDPGGEWEPLVDLLLARADEALVLGDYRPDRRTGPAVWLRCVVDGAIAAPGPPGDRPPIVYLPGVGRQALRAGADCPDRLKPLVELLFRGAWWRHPNGGDWTAAAFLTSPKALGLDVAGDRATAAALRRALPEVAATPVAQLAGRRLTADDFDRMLAGDVARDLLRWMGDPEGARGRLGENGWRAFCSRCRKELGFDPAREADVAAGERLASGAGPWAAVWERYAEAPAGYGGVAELLGRSRPAGALPLGRDRWPDLNAEDEQAVRGALAALPALPHAAACEAVAELERRHGDRRNWVWARLGRAPLAEALRPLAVLAGAARRALGGAAPDDVAAAYLERGWQADLAVWEALAAAPVDDEACVRAAVRHLAEPWLEESARAFQAALARAPLPGSGAQPPVAAADDECLLFVDGLRFDLARRLASRLEDGGCRVGIGRRWAALPTVTATAKPAVTPLAAEIDGGALDPTFAARLKEGGRPADARNLRTALEACGYQLLGAGADAAADAPRAHPARGWLEAGEFDRMGHRMEARIAGQLAAEIERLAVRIERVLAAGWRAVRVVTDHGWLLLPGGLPKVDLPKHLTASRWARCAVVAGEASPEVARVPWHWNGGQWFAAAPGIACFNRSVEYAHGGLSVQECVVPDLAVTRAGGEETAARIASVTWRGLRCFVEAEVRGGPAVADLRLERPGGASVAAAAKPVGPEGAVSLVLAGDEHESAALALVLLDAAGRALAHRPTRVGEDG